MPTATSSPETDGPRRSILASMSRALGRELHVLVQRPDLTWPQLLS